MGQNEEDKAAADAQREEFRLHHGGSVQRAADLAAELAVTKLHLARALAENESLKKPAA